jgi:hypothetical protein
MISSKRAVMMLALALTLAAGAWAQRGGRGGMGMGQQPPMPGLQNPALGSGAEYQMSAKGKDMDIAYAIVGKEDVSGSPGFWVEMRMQNAELGGEMVTKMLMVSTGPEAGMKRMIVQRPGQPPMEMTGMMMGLMQHQPHSTQPNTGGKADMGELVGTEIITVPAGTFSCQHYRKQQQNGTVDMWISSQVTPYAVVKLVSADMTMVLEKTLTNETSHVKGEPQKMQFPGMPQ